MVQVPDAPLSERGRAQAALLAARLSKLDVANVEPMVSASGLASVVRDDVPEASLTPDAILANAPARAPRFP